MTSERRTWIALSVLKISLLALVLGNAVPGVAAAAIGLNFFVMTGVYFFMSFYLQNMRGYSPLHAGLLTIPVAIGQLAAVSRSLRRQSSSVVAEE